MFPTFEDQVVHLDPESKVLCCYNVTRIHAVTRESFKPSDQEKEAFTILQTSKGTFLFMWRPFELTWYLRPI